MMSGRLGSVLLVGLTLTAVSGCGGGQDQTAVPAELSKLVPEHTAAILRFASLDSLNRHATELAASVGDTGEEVDARDLLQMLPGQLLGDPRLIDSQKPIVLAITAKRATPPGITALVPTTDTSAYAKSLPAPPAESQGNYVAVSLFGKYEVASKPSPLLARLSPATLSMAGNVTAFAKHYKVLIDSGLELLAGQMTREMERSNPEMDAEAVADLYLALIHTILESGDSLDLSIDYRDGQLDIATKLGALPGSDLAGWSSPPIDPAPLARGMTGTGSIEVLFQADMEKLEPRYDAMIDTLLDVYPEETRTAMRHLMTSYKDVYGMIGSGMAMEGDVFADGGMRMTAQMMPEDPAALVAKMTAMFANDAMGTLGITSQAPQSSEDGDRKFCDFALTIDANKMLAATGQGATEPGEATEQQERTASIAKAMLGGSAIPIRTAHEQGRLVMALGGDSKQAASDALAATTGSWSPAVQSALRQVEGCNPLVVERIDYAAMMSGVARLMKQASPDMPALNIPTDSSANIVVFGGIQGDEWLAGASVDIAGLGRMIRAMMPR